MYVRMNEDKKAINLRVNRGVTWEGLEGGKRRGNRSNYNFQK